MGTETDSFFTVSQDQGYTLVEFRTESLMNPVELERVGRGLYRLVDVEHRHQVLLDFTGVKYLSSQLRESPGGSDGAAGTAGSYSRWNQS